MREVLFVTGTRADFGKLKPVIRACQDRPELRVSVFVTGMHLMRRYGYTVLEIEDAGIPRLYRFINQNPDDGMDQVLAKTISGFSDYVKENRPDLVVVHGDRVESLAAAIVGALNNIAVAHIEGGEVSGTVDEAIRHATSKLSHHHFVANDAAADRLLQMGEPPERIYTIGSPEMDVMLSPDLPPLDAVLEHYDIPFDTYALAVLHPVTTELERTRVRARAFVRALLASGDHYVVVLPNNDHGSREICEELGALEGDERFRLFPSMRFEYFLTLLRHARYIVGNSSAGVRQAPVYGVPSVNVGSRQNRRASAPTIVDAGMAEIEILEAVERARDLPRVATMHFGSGNSAEAFVRTLRGPSFWNSGVQKAFLDRAPASP